jgi:phytoene dehydrogenase-like protein
MADYDVIVIGAGNGGLTAAVSLAQRRRKVLLLERHNIPGGCATSFIRGRFEFEVALHQLSGLGTEANPGPLRGVLNNLGILDRVEFVEELHLYRAVIPDRLDITIPADREGAIDALKTRFPEEAAAIDAFFELVWAFAMQFIGAFYLRDPERSREKYPLYFRYALRSFGSVLDEYFRDPLLKMTLGTYWGYAGLPPSRLSFSDMTLMLWAYIEYKPFHIKGGSQALSNALLDAFLEAGGTVRFSCGAERIVVSENRVVAVITEHGDEITCDHVVSNAGTLRTYIDLIGSAQVPANSLKALRQSTVGPSAVTVYLGLDCEPQELGIDISTSFITLDSDFDAQFAAWRTLDSPRMTAFTCYDVADPDFSPAGACQVVLINLQYLDHWLTVPPARYADAKYQYARSLMNIAERVYPGFCSHIEELEVATPITHMRYLGHPGGAIYGFDQYAKDANLFVSPLSPITGLYFSGAWVGAGGFQPTLESGVAATKAIIKSQQQ